jgi:hypothetical protein
VARRLRGAEAAAALLTHTYLRPLRRLRPDRYLEWLATVAAVAPVFRVERPAHGWSGEETAAAVETVVAGLHR